MIARTLPGNFPVFGQKGYAREHQGAEFATGIIGARKRAVTELTTLAATIARWEGQIVTVVLSGVTNAGSESLNRIAKLEARQA